ncbi:type II toxin-antitoxin system PemK/MazF family toxin [Ornithinimicrobium sp. F0845]|uniref:type II toxin-antitoxin system PemK/MazF family toxin n=1 Tax=Ornithinimicrobium sp. F0845 TaxID=2926412 RepID=UPI001FF1019C|nr:type II toxin-antitoxin system PemK/MazF family toxin [Ornithinimicrobium sp. F0845]MCK0110618.1 type II toxin-antitoxin system PemK/MazF family toxin [Ornithinimicrobium sp. F0845]
MLIRGDVIEVPGPRRSGGHEQRGPRLGVVVQSDDLRLSTVLLAPTSRSAPPRLFRPLVQIAGESTCVLVEQLRTVDLTRLGRLRDHLDRDDRESVDDALELVLALDLRR